MHKITPFLMFNDHTGEAVEFYASVFEDLRLINVTRTRGETDDEKGKVTSATFEIGGQTFMAYDGGPHFSFSDGISLFVDCHDQAEVDRLWEALSEGGEKGRCGWLKDRFGVSWQIVPNALGQMLGDPDPEKAGRVMQAMLKMDKIIIEDLDAAFRGE
jgi:predicted 3-demethylubiquinone-9 3-methyltransferase (glyoxalase superfamily)